MDDNKIWDDFLSHRTVTSVSLKEIFDHERNAVSQLLKDNCKELREENQKAHKQLLVDITNIIEDHIGPLVVRVNTIESSVANIQDEILQLKSAVSELKSTTEKQTAEIDELKKENIELKSTSFDKSIVEKSINDLEERLEDRTNRQLRKTLVITGVKESDHESWADTKKIVAKTISTNLKISFDDSFDMLERVHRSAPTKNVNKIGRRDIYAAIHEWSDAEFLTSKFRKLNARNRHLNVHFNYKYGPMTTRRRNAALKLRRKLIDEKTIVQGYLSFPVKLFVKFSNSENAAWEEFEDFSKFSMADLPQDSH